MGLRSEDYTPVPAMIRHRAVSKTSTPVDTVEAYLDEHPEKRIENQENGGMVEAQILLFLSIRLKEIWRQVSVKRPKLKRSMIISRHYAI